MSGSLQHLGGDRWRVRVYAGIDPITRKQITRSRSFHANGERAAARASAKIEAALREQVNEHAARRDTIAELADHWLAMKRREGRAPSTLAGYQAICDRIVARFGTWRVADLRGRDIDQWYGELLDERDRITKQPVRSAATVQHHHAVLRAMLRLAERHEMVDSVATRRASPPPSTRPEITPPTTSALRVVLDAAGPGSFAQALRVIAGTGIRRGELCGLWWSDLNGDQLTVRRSVTDLPGHAGLHIGPTKGRKPRPIGVGPEVLAAIAAQRALLEQQAAAREIALPPDGPMWANLRADNTGMTPVSPGWLSHNWARLRAQHGMTGTRLHDLRHWNATTQIDQGVPVATVAGRLGHSQVSTTLNIYTHRVAASDREAAGVLDAALSGGD